MNAEVRLLQLSDPHLFASADARLRGVNSFDSLQDVLRHALSRKPDTDAVLCTGELASQAPVTQRSIRSAAREKMLNARLHRAPHSPERAHLSALADSLRAVPSRLAAPSAQ